VLGAALSGCAEAPDPNTSEQEAAELGRPDPQCSWSQWAQDAAHGGQSCIRGQEPVNTLAHIVYDPFEFQEMAEGSGALLVHYQVPLTDSDGNFYMMHKGGTFTPCDPPGSGTPAPCGLNHASIVNEIWSEKRYHRRANGAFEETWSFETDWKPITAQWEPMFQPALAGPILYVPGAGGSVWQVLTTFGHAVPLQRINPFPTVDPNTYVTSGVTVDRRGFVYWNVLQQDPVTHANRGFLVKAAPWGQTWKVDYETLIPGAPGALDSCFFTFAFASPRPPRPWPPTADALPPQRACGRQRPGVNVTPAIGRDGTIFTVSTADLAHGYSYIVALRPDLSLRWATSLRGLVQDGCGVHRTDSPEGDVPCSATFSAVGVDPTTNLSPAMTVSDISTSSPVVLPDGGVLYGALDNYNFSRGHLLKLDRSGQFVASYSFGWDTTPAIYEHDRTYSIVVKDAHYLTSGPFYLTQLDHNLQVEWRFQNTSTQACARQPDGTLRCSDASPDGELHPNGFEWCVNAPAVDARGNVYANAEDGFVYRIGQGGVLQTQTFLNQALGAAYTPIALDPAGHVYASNNGELTVLGR
jgi:hypothetical protein